ncbi:TerC family protein [Luteimonas sp BLCC-B24]|uniref:TerC family protein n=1 Tax=Luteimonas sp. BLCC-B24 TaxID=3025317 RepID=UPI00234DD64E|nr:TerC family protein [Luteimonas sp. BLCC-B24]MDC7807679.1 TerC family protein [Luteimonas sp. BLCC-B24]
MMELLTDPQVWILLITLSTIEIVLGIDNLVFISIAVSKLPVEKREFARKFGIAVACITRIALLLTLAWLARLTDPLFAVLGRGVSVRDLILILGGLFLIVKGVLEIREQIKGEDPEAHGTTGKAAASFGAVIAQIAVIDIVFSLDSVIAAVGMAGDYIPVMVAAILVAVSVMLLAAQPLGRFIDANPTVKMLALAFIVLIGVYLMLDGIGVHIPRGYLYGSMGFSAAVELLNLWAKRNAMRVRGEPIPPVDAPTHPLPR